MVAATTRFSGLSVPPEFRWAPYTALYDCLLAAQAGGKLSDEQRDHVFGALHGLLYRFIACAEHSRTFTASIIANGNGPPFPERYYQERELHEFFAAGLSSLECLAFGIFTIGNVMNPAAFPMASPEDLRNIGLGTCRSALMARYPSEPITAELDALIPHKTRGMSGKPEFNDWTDLRNILTHRASPPRAFSVSVGGPEPGTATFRGSQVLDRFSIDRTTTARRLAWLADTMATLLPLAESFAAKL
jgi:hypothetical protein